MFLALWTNKDVLHILPHWNWNEGDSVDVWAYTNYDEVELFINGVSQGVKTKQPGQFHLSWKTAFQPGSLKAVGKKNNGLVTTCLQQDPDVAASRIKVVEIKTVDKPSKLDLIAD